jgi:hypothetical protein
MATTVPGPARQDGKVPIAQDHEHGATRMLAGEEDLSYPGSPLNDPAVTTWGEENFHPRKPRSVGP